MKKKILIVVAVVLAALILAFVVLNVVLGCINVLRHEVELAKFNMLTAMLIVLLAIWQNM